MFVTCWGKIHFLCNFLSRWRIRKFLDLNVVGQIKLLWNSKCIILSNLKTLPLFQTSLTSDTIRGNISRLTSSIKNELASNIRSITDTLFVWEEGNYGCSFCHEKLLRPEEKGSWDGFLSTHTKLSSFDAAWFYNGYGFSVCSCVVVWFYFNSDLI